MVGREEKLWSGHSRDGSDVYSEHTHGSISSKDKTKSLLFYQFSLCKFE